MIHLAKKLGSLTADAWSAEVVYNCACAAAECGGSKYYGW